MKHTFIATLFGLIGFANASGQQSLPQQQLVVNLSLLDAVQLSQSNNPAVVQARLQAMIAEGAIVSAAGDFDTVLFSELNYNYNESPASGFFSSFGNTVSTSYSASQGIRSNFRSGGNLEFKINEGYDDFNYLAATQSNTSVSVSFTQPLLRGAFSMVATANERKAKLSHNSASLQVSQSSVDAVQSVVDAYWNLSFALSDLGVKQQSLQLAENLRDITIAKFEVGAVAEVEVTQTRADIAARVDAVLVAQNVVDNNHDALRKLVSAFDSQNDWAIDFKLVSELPRATEVVDDWHSAWQRAMSSRADIKKLQDDIESDKIDLEVAASNMRPKLDFTATGNYSAQDRQVGLSLDRLFDRDFPGYTVGFVFELPITDNQHLGAEMQAKNQLLLSKRILRDRGNELAQQVRQALHDVNYYSQRVAVTEHSVNMAELKLQSEQLKLSEGASTNYQVLQIQADLAIAQSQNLQAKTEYAKASVKFETVQGRTPVF
ncbi:MAG: TolC family protein [Planctomycetes bacterium]|nr:TolC family protein [Planctomycetota bacterium]